MGRSSILLASWCVGPCSMWVCNPGRNDPDDTGMSLHHITSIKIKKRNGERERDIMIDIDIHIYREREIRLDLDKNLEDLD